MSPLSGSTVFFDESTLIEEKWMLKRIVNAAHRLIPPGSDQRIFIKLDHFIDGHMFFIIVFGSSPDKPQSVWKATMIGNTDPYFKNTGIFIAAKSANLLLTPECLKGKTIGLQTATAFEDYVRQVYGKNVTVKRYNSIQDALLDLEAGRVDTVFGDSVVMLDWLKNRANNRYTQIGEPIDDPHFFGVGIGLAVKKTNTALLSALNTGLSAIKADGSYQKIVDKYFESSH